MAQTATVQIQMPEMGESVTEGIVLEWHVAEGDFVNEGDTVVEVSTDKVDAEVPAPTAGVITKLIASVDDEVPVGAPLAEMEPGEEGSAEGSAARPAGPGRGSGGACGRRRSRRPRPPADRTPPAEERLEPPAATKVGGDPKTSERLRWLVASRGELGSTSAGSRAAGQGRR